MSRTEPTPEQADLFARYRRHVEGERELKPEMQAAAAAALQAGVSTGALAKATGLTPEPFRRMARDLGVERKRPPTVGREVTGAAPPTAAPATPRTDASPPPASLRLPTAVAGLSPDRAAALADRLRADRRDWVEGVAREVSDAPAAWRDHVLVAAALGMGVLADGDLLRG